MLCSALSFSSCSVLYHNDGPNTERVTESLDESETTDLELDMSHEDNSAIIHMIQPINGLEGWSSGKTQNFARYYIDDMMEILDGLEWKDDDTIRVSNDFHFRINLDRPLSELDAYRAFFHSDDTEATSNTSPDAESEKAPEENDTNKSLSVQYLINYKDRMVNMRLTDYSAQSFDVYAEIGESEMKMLVLCLKYYFGPEK